MPRIPRKKWRELILKVWVPSLRQDRARSEPDQSILSFAGLRATNAHRGPTRKPRAGRCPDQKTRLARHRQGARAPPPTPSHEAPESSFASSLDGIVYELEPWEKARRERLASYARERDHLAGIVVYDGEYGDASDSPSEYDAKGQDLEESQETSFADDFDQRPPPQWEEIHCDQTLIADATVPQTQAKLEIDQSIAEDEQQWDQTPHCWSDTPLGQWAIEANNWDGIDPIPHDDEPVFYTD